MIIDREAHRDAMAQLADRYFADQCPRLGYIAGIPRPRKSPDFSAPQMQVEAPQRLKPSRSVKPTRSFRVEDFDPEIPRTS